jgi:hypothetical protein
VTTCRALVDRRRSSGERLLEEKVCQEAYHEWWYTVLILWLLVFRVPTTHDVLTTLLHPGYRKSHLDLLNLGLLGLQLVLFFALPQNIGRIFFLFYFAFWRSAYDAGLGWMLTKQSKRKWMVKEVQRRGWLDEKRRPQVREWIRKQLQDKMGKDYSFDVGAITATTISV